MIRYIVVDFQIKILKDSALIQVLLLGGNTNSRNGLGSMNQLTKNIFYRVTKLKKRIKRFNIPLINIASIDTNGEDIITFHDQEHENP